jgi:CMP-N-acetylneuraminic acid synthetase
LKQETKPVCIIPARKNSKRIKNKNLLNFGGKPLIAHSITEALKSKIFSRVVVTTDSKQIAKIAIKYGAEVPFIRSKKLSNDTAGIKAVTCDCIKRLKSQNVKYHFIIYATNPLLKMIYLKKAFIKLKKLNYNLLIGVKKFETNPIKAITINKDDLNFKFKKILLKNSQTFNNFYYDDGSFTILETKSYLRRKNFIAKKSTYFLHGENDSLDLNTKEDLVKLRKIFNSRN